MEQIPGTNEKRMALIKRNIHNAYIMADESKPARFEEMVKSWAHTLSDIPIDCIDESFLYAIKTNNKYKVVQVGQVSRAWSELRKTKLGPEHLAAQSTEIDHSPAWYQMHIDQCRAKYPESGFLLNTIDIGDTKLIDPRNNEDDLYFSKNFSLLYNRRFGESLAKKFDMGGNG